MRSNVASLRCCELVVIGAALTGSIWGLRAAEVSTSTSATRTDGQQPAGALVAQAIEAEVQADLPRRGDLLAQALSMAPDFAPARWQLGQVRQGQQWLSIDAALDQARQDELLAQYREMRARYGDGKEGQLVLARWCQKHQLTDEMRAHATRLLDLSPDDAEAKKLLNLSWYEGSLLTPREIAARKALAEYDKAVVKKWQPRLTALRDRLESKSRGESEAALEELSGIRDPEAIDALEAVFKNRPALMKEVVKVVGKIPGQKATEVLLRQALTSKREDLRLAACEQLRERPLHSYVPKLMAALSKPLETKFDVVRDSDGVHFRQTVRRENANDVVENSQDTDVTLLVPNPNLGAIIGQTYAETFVNAQKTAKTAALLNRKAAEYNGLIYWILERATNQRLPHDPDAWWSWWREYNELATSEKPTLADNSYKSVTVPYVPYLPPDVPIYTAVAVPTSTPTPQHSGPTPAPTTIVPFTHQYYTPGVGLWHYTNYYTPGVGVWHYSNECFARGTQVWTQIGMMAIEEIQRGDRVLSQDPASGELTYKPVLEVTVGNQALVAIHAASEQVVASRGHMFWVSGKGWRMAKHLEIGDRLHTVSGWTEITSLQDLPADETHNLVVADFGTYFVGNEKMFVHDITMLRATSALVPGQAER